VGNLYCYCIFKQTDLEEEALINNSVLIAYQDIVLLCEDMETEVKATKEGMLKHDNIIRNVFQQSEVIPISYGTVINSKEEAEKFLVNNYARFKKIFARIQNKIEVALKLVWNKDSFSKEVDDKEISKLKEQLSKQHFVTEQDKIELGRLVEQRVNKLRGKYEKEIAGRLRELAEDFRISENLTPRMALNASFLIDRSAEAAFDEAVNEFYHKYNDKFDFRYIGPLPPYSFINEKIELE